MRVDESGAAYSMEGILHDVIYRMPLLFSPAQFFYQDGSCITWDAGSIICRIWRQCGDSCKLDLHLLRRGESFFYDVKSVQALLPLLRQIRENMRK
jgi:hypothetical protein